MVLLEIKEGKKGQGCHGTVVGFDFLKTSRTAARTRSKATKRAGSERSILGHLVVNK